MQNPRARLASVLLYTLLHSVFKVLYCCYNLFPPLPLTALGPMQPSQLLPDSTTHRAFAKALGNANDWLRLEPFSREGPHLRILQKKGYCPSRKKRRLAELRLNHGPEDSEASNRIGLNVCGAHKSQVKCILKISVKMRRWFCK